MMDITFKIVVHALRLSAIEIPKMYFFLPIYQRLSVATRKKMYMATRKKMCMTARKKMRDNEEDVCGREKDHWNLNEGEVNQVHSDSRSPVLDTLDKLTEPTACSLLDGTEINVELPLAKVFPFQKAFHAVLVQDGYIVVQSTYVWASVCHYPLPIPIDGGDIATLAKALVQRIQWPKERILIPPMMRHPNPEAAIGSWDTSSDGGNTT
jgi:hypothetical protein